MSAYQNEVKAVATLKEKNGSSWSAINPGYAARIRIQNRFKTGLDIAEYIAAIMRKDMAEYDADSSVYIQSLSYWHGFIGQQKLISIKKHLKTADKCYLYLSDWMVAALCSDFGPLPGQSMYGKTVVSGLIKELYTFLRQTDAHELGLLFTGLDAARATGNKAKEAELLVQIDNSETHVAPIIVSIDVGFGNAGAAYLLAKKMIKAGAYCIQIENQVSDKKQCDHQDGKVTVPHIDSLVKVSAVRYIFLELGVDDGMIVAHTDSLGAGLIKQIAATNKPSNLDDLYNFSLDCEETSEVELGNGDAMIKHEGKLLRPKRLALSLLQFHKGIGEDHCILGCITSLQSGADLLWIGTKKPHVDQIKTIVDHIRGVIPNARLVYNNNPSFNWTLNFHQQMFGAFVAEGKGVSAYDRNKLVNIGYDDTELTKTADEKIHIFQRDGSVHAGIFHHPITPPTYHVAALSIDNLIKGYFTGEGMLVYVKSVQRQELRQGIACVKHQNMTGSNIGDNHEGYFVGEAILKADGEDNTMNQFH